MLLKMVNPRCDKCGKSGPDVEQFADIYRQYEIKHGRRNPGNLCGKCAGHETSLRLYQEAKDKFMPTNPSAAKEYEQLLNNVERKGRLH